MYYLLRKNMKAGYFEAEKTFQREIVCGHFAQVRVTLLISDPLSIGNEIQPSVLQLREFTSLWHHI